MGASPGNIEFDYEVNGSLPSVQSLNITPNDNTDYFGDGPWIDSKPYWLNVSKTSQGELPALAKYNVGLIESQVKNLGAETYDGQIVFLYKTLVGRLDRIYVSVTLEVTAEPPPPDPPESVGVEYSSSVGNECGEIDVTFTIGGGVPPYRLILNNQYQPGTFNSPHTISIARSGTPYQAIIEDSNSNRITITPNTSQTVTTLIGPRKVSSNDITINVRNYSVGSTANVTISYFNSKITPYEYSLNGNDWQTDSSFSNLSPATYTLYVRDSLGCVVTKSFIVDGSTELTETVFSISEINPIRFAEVNNYKPNYYNRLSFIENREIANAFIQKWISDDIIPTQFRTNAQYINVYAIDCQDNEYPIGISQKTENIGRIGYTSVTLFSSPTGKGTLYFGVVDVLDPDTNLVVDSIPYGQSLPNYIKVGQEVEVAGIGFSEVTQIYYSETFGAYVAELDFSYIGTASERTQKSIYNVQPYEIYEFNTVMSLLPNKFQLVIEAGTDDQNINFNFVSETQQLFNDQDNYLYIQYSDKINRGDMNYQTGIKPFIRLEGYPNYEGEQETSGYNGDQTYYKVNDEIYNTQTIRFPYEASAMAHKTRLIIAHDILLINNIECKLAESPEIDGEETVNDKQLIALFKITGNQFIPGGTQNIIDTENSLAGIEIHEDDGLLLWTRNAN